jgi:uncharacterized protein
MPDTTWLQEIRPRLAAVFNDRLRDVVLYGSEARGEARPDSDLDLLVVLEGPVRLGPDLDSVVRALYPLQLALDRPIHALPVTASAFEAGDYALYRAARREGRSL